VAHAKAAQVLELARAHKHPLRCVTAATWAGPGEFGERIAPIMRQMHMAHIGIAMQGLRAGPGLFEDPHISQQVIDGAPRP
jgi:hypothetical protein